MGLGAHPARGRDLLPAPSWRRPPAGQTRPREALEDLRRAIELNPHLDITHYSMGRACFMLGRVREGVAEIEKAVRGSYTSIWIYNWGDWNHQNHARRETLQDLDRVVKE